ncbi:MAG: tyrosine-type recombinase/integrase [Bdellovibrionales bacterium]
MLNLWVEFFEDLELVRGRSRNTISAYRRDLLLYEEFKNTSRPIAEYYNFLQKNGLSTRSQARAISSLRTYLKFLERNDISAPELRELKLPKVEKKAPKIISLEEFDKLVKAAVGKNDSQTMRNQLCLYLMFGLGLRVTELTSLDVESVQLDEGTLRVLGKGSKERILPLNPLLLEMLSSYLGEHRKEVCFDLNERSLIVNKKSNRPSRIDIWRWLDSWSKKAGFLERVHPHQFRHACATSLLESGANLRSIQILLGHTSLQTTQMYTAVSKGHLNKTLDEKHPFSNVDLGLSESKDN